MKSVAACASVTLLLLAGAWALVFMGQCGWPPLHWDSCLSVTPAVNRAAGRVDKRVVSMPIAPTVRLGNDVVIPHKELVNLYGCSIGDNTKIGAFVEVQKGAVIGARCKISSHSFICEGVTIEDEVFIGHGVLFINDRFPRAAAGGQLQTDADWQVIPTRVCRGAALGSGAVILCGVTIGPGALIGAGAVVTRDVPEGAKVAGVPARLLREGLAPQ